jgi:hypothetical protein
VISIIIATLAENYNKGREGMEMQKTPFGISVQRARIRYAEDLRLKKYTMTQMAHGAHISPAHLSRCIRGIEGPSCDFIEKICTFLCSAPQERRELFHSAGYLTPEEFSAEFGTPLSYRSDTAA